MIGLLGFPLVAFQLPLAWVDSRCSDDNFSIYQLFVERRVLTLLVGCGDQGMALVLEPFPDTKLVLGGA